MRRRAGGLRPGGRRQTDDRRHPCHKALACALLLATLTAACGDAGPARASLSVAEAMAGDTAGFARAEEPRAFVFPADHGPHPEFRTEWWYFTGNLTAEGRDFGFQLTFFRNALRPDSIAIMSDWATRQAYMGHFALTDVAGERFRAFERFDRGAVGLAGSEGRPLRVWIGDWEATMAAEGGDVSGEPDPGEPPPERDPTPRAGVDAGRVPSAETSELSPRAPGADSLPTFRVRAAEDGVAVDLTLRAVKPVVLQGDRGLSQKGPEPGNASYYYSFTRLAASGTVTAGGEVHPVTGLAWLDREWSTSALSPGLVGWDWFALQLNDGTELMVYRLREDDGGTAPFSAGTFVRDDGAVTRLGASDFVLGETDSWTSPEGARYPSGWDVRVPGLDLELTVEPRLADQELALAFRYWEGAVSVEGTRAGRPVAGRGYVELTGYADEPRP